MKLSIAKNNYTFGSLAQLCFELTKTEKMIFERLRMYKKGVGANKLAKKLKKDVTTIQRNLKGLHRKGLVNRKKNGLDEGGYEYLYTAVSNAKFKLKVINVLEDFQINVLEKLREL